MIYKIESLFTEDEAFSLILKHEKDCIEISKQTSHTMPTEVLSKFRGKSLNEGEILPTLAEVYSDPNLRKSSNKIFWQNGAMAQFVKYTKGDHFNWHKDYHQEHTIIIALNNDYTGGELEIKEHGSYNLKTGDCIMFPALIPHRIIPITSGIRYSIVIWHQSINK